MKIIALIIMAALSPCLVGCETVAGTVSGAGSGMQKDYDNTVEVAKEIPPRVMRLDEWIHKNMW